MCSLLEIKVIASASVEKWVLDPSGTLKCYLKSPAREGKANRALCLLISRLIQVPAREVVIIRGHATNYKVVKIPVKLSQGDFIKLLAL